MAEIIPCYRPQGKPFYATENTHYFLIDFGLPALIFAFSLFFSLLAGKAQARTVRVGLHGAPTVFRNNINWLQKQNSLDTSEAWRSRFHKAVLIKPEIRPLQPLNSPAILGRKIRICHFFRAEPDENGFAYQQTGSHECMRPVAFLQIQD